MNTARETDDPAANSENTSPTESTSSGACVLGLSVESVVPKRHLGRWLAAAIVLLLMAQAAYVVVGNPRFQWDTVGEYLFDGAILSGVRTTIVLTVVAMSLGIALGLILALMRLSKNPIVASASWTYAWVFRALPTLVTLILIYNIAALFPEIALGVPFGGPTFWSADANRVVRPLVAGIAGLTLTQGALMSEIIRSGLISVDRGQREAAAALGMPRYLAFRRIVLPQAIRVILPPTGNNAINMLKYTSLVSIVAISDLLYSAQKIYARTFEVVPLLIVASLWYLGITSVMMIGQGALERRFGRGK